MNGHGYNRLDMLMASAEIMPQCGETDLDTKKVAWCTPFPSKGAGGFRTILQNARALERAGLISDFYFLPEQNCPVSEVQIAHQLTEWYGYSPNRIITNSVHLDGHYDLAIATAWNTASFIADQDCAHKAYFIQDYEPLFFPIGAEYFDAQDTYSLGLTPITIGRWLARKCRSMCDKTPFITDFCADLNIYKRHDGTEKEFAVCAIHQPEKPRRASSLLLEALGIVKDALPSLTIYLYGTDHSLPDDLPFVNLGILNVEECNRLYNRCLCGISMSTSNPSRIPFEMMASGLPVIDLMLPNNTYDLPDSAVRLASPNPTSIAQTIINLLTDEQQLKEMSQAGTAFMQDRDIEREGLQFVTACSLILNERPAPPVADQPTYRLSQPDESMEIAAIAKRRRIDMREHLALDAAPLACRDNRLHIEVSGLNIHPSLIRVASWSNPLQEDIVWENLIERDGCWECAIQYPDRISSPSLYHFHLYIKRSDAEELEFLASFDKALAPLPSSTEEVKGLIFRYSAPLSNKAGSIKCTLKTSKPCGVQDRIEATPINLLETTRQHGNAPAIIRAFLSKVFRS